MKNLYVGNMEASTTAEDLKPAFGAYGPVEMVTIITDKATALLVDSASWKWLPTKTQKRQSWV